MGEEVFFRLKESVKEFPDSIQQYIKSNNFAMDASGISFTSGRALYYNTASTVGNWSQNYYSIVPPTPKKLTPQEQSKALWKLAEEFRADRYYPPVAKTYSSEHGFWEYQPLRDSWVLMDRYHNQLLEVDSEVVRKLRVPPRQHNSGPAPKAPTNPRTKRHLTRK